MGRPGVDGGCRGGKFMENAIAKILKYFPKKTKILKWQSFVDDLIENNGGLKKLSYLWYAGIYSKEDIRVANFGGMAAELPAKQEFYMLVCNCVIM